MKKRPLCAICILFLVIQAARVCLWGAGDETSALAGALTGENPGTEESRSAREESVTLQGAVYRIEEKTTVTAVCVKDNDVSVSGQKFNQ